MPHVARHLTFAAVAALAVASLAPRTAALARCSLMVFGSTQPGLYFVGRATGDTALGGAGDVREGGIFDGPGRRIAERTTRPLFGQVVRVGRVGGTQGAALEAALRDDRREVLLVPWGYGPDCSVGPWSGSARWVAPDSSGLFTRARLRPESLWVDHRPTLDVFAAWYEPYPHGSSLRFERASAARAGVTTWLTVDELFGLYDALPDREGQERDPQAAAAAADEWRAAHPELAERAPAHGMLPYVYMAADLWPALQRVRAISPPVAGTYQLAVSFAGGESRTLFVRLAGKSLSSITTAAPVADRPWRRSLTVVGYKLDALGARTVEALPRSVADPRPQPCDLVQVSVTADAQRAADGATTWRGDLDPGFLLRCFRGDEEVAGVERRVQEAWRERYAARVPGAPYVPELGAVFRLDRGGELTLEQRIEHRGEPLIVVRGRRVSTEALAVPW